MADLVVLMLVMWDNGLWSHIVDSTAPNFLLHTRMLRHDSVGYAKVNELELHSSADEVLRLEVVVDHTLFVDHLHVHVHAQIPYI